MAGSRLLDIQARRMREKGQGFYTIGSAGHESNAFVAEALRPTDPALLHYRSGGFFLYRALQAGRPLREVLRNVMLGNVAAVADPASGGRHKVWGGARSGSHSPSGVRSGSRSTPGGRATRSRSAVSATRR
jgi:2-oxoisovalerate dehydrogenase E1 component